MPTDADAYQRLTRALDDHRGDAEAYRRLGAQMTARRHFLGPRYGNRRLFVRERLVPLGLKESAANKLAFDLESGRLQGREGYSPGSMLALADAYGITPDEIVAVLGGGSLEPLEKPSLPPPQPAPVTAEAILAEARDATLFRFTPNMQAQVDVHFPDLAVLVANALARNPGSGPVPPGAEVFGNGTPQAEFEARRWDNLVTLGKERYPPDGFSQGEMLQAAALARVRDAEQQAGHGSAAAGR